MNRVNIKNYLQSDKAPNFLVFLFLFLICFLVYFNSLSNDFIFDDNFLLVKNLYVRNFSLSKIFKTDVFHFHPQENTPFSKYYRPLQLLSYSFEYRFFALNPLGYRLNNIIIHSLNSFLVFLLIYLILKDKIIALLSSTLFCIHPIQVCLVAFIAGRSNLLQTLFMFLSLLTFVNYFIKQQKWQYILSLLLFIFAFLSQEGALLLPFFILIYAIFLKIDKRRLFIFLSPYLFIAIFYIVLRSKFLPCDKFNIIDILSLKRLLSFIWYMFVYLEQLILPAGFQFSFFGKSLLFKYILFFLSFTIMVYCLIKALVIKDKIIISAILLYLTGALHIFGLTDTIAYLGYIISEHYIYLASIGYFIFIAYLILKSYSRFKKFATIFLLTITLIYSTLTVINNTNYKNELTFYNYILRVGKAPAWVRVNLGNIFYTNKMYDKAIEQVNLVLLEEPNVGDAYFLLGNVLKDRGDLNKAIEVYKKVIILNSRASEAFNNLGLAYNTLGRDKEALESFKKALELDPESLFALRNLADLFISKKSFPQALELCKRLLELNHYDVPGRVRLGIILAELGRFKESERVFKEALKLDAHSLEAMKNLGALYGNTGNFDKAILIWERALELAPSDKSIKDNIEEAKKLKQHRADE